MGGDNEDIRKSMPQTDSDLWTPHKGKARHGKLQNGPSLMGLNASTTSKCVGDFCGPFLRHLLTFSPNPAITVNNSAELRVAWGRSVSPTVRPAGERPPEPCGKSGFESPQLKVGIAATAWRRSTHRSGVG